MIQPDTILQGCFIRHSIALPLEITDTQEQREDKLRRRAAGERKWTPWKKIDGWKISKLRLRDLGPVWTDNAEFKCP